MDKNLAAAITERLSLGRTDAEIINELVSVGYTTEQATAAVAAVQQSSVGTLATAIPAPLIGYWALIKTSWQLSTHNLGLFGGALLSFIGAFVIVFALVAGLGLVSAVVPPVALVVAGFLMVILVTALFATPYAALMRALLHRQSRQGFWSAYGELLPQFWRIILLSLIWQLAISGGYLALIIPGIALTGYLFFSMMRFVDVGDGGFQALHGSYTLVRGRWWSVFGRMLFSILLISLSSLLIIVLPILLWGIVNVMQSSAGSFGGVMNMYVVPFMMAVSFVLYFAIMTCWLTSMMVALYESLRSSVEQSNLVSVRSGAFTGAMIFFMVLGVAAYALQFVLS